MSAFLTGAAILIDGAWQSGRGILVQDGALQAVLPDSECVMAERVALPAGTLLAPGLVDVQVNGGGGVLFNDTPTAEAARAIAAAHRTLGTTAILPTLITDTTAAMQGAALAVKTRIPGVIGVHFEGPFLSPARPGVHAAHFIRPPSQSDVIFLEDLAAQLDGAVLLTLAPETVDGATLRRLSDAGVILSAGHSEASYECCTGAIADGLRGFTHVFNAMPGAAARSPGLVTAALLDPDTWCAVIADGVHVHPAMLRLLLAAKSPGRVMLVSDAMPPTGTPLERFELQGRTILRERGRLATQDGTLAGADICLADAVRYAVRTLGLSSAQALTMASEVPAAFSAQTADRTHRGRLPGGSGSAHAGARCARHLARRPVAGRTWRSVRARGCMSEADTARFATYVATLGRGPGRSRALTREEAADAMGMLLSGAADRLQVGAFLMLLRYRGEDPAEITGLVEGARPVTDIAGAQADLDWPSYGAGRTRGAPWFLLAALALAASGVRVLMHGTNEFTGGTTVEDALAQLGIPPANGADDARRLLLGDRFAYLPIRALSPPLAELLGLRRLLGLRSPINTVARLLNPAGAPAGVDGVFHPPYIETHLAVAERLARPRLLVLKGGGGEAERNPRKPVTVHLWSTSAGRHELALPALDVSDEPAEPDFTALWRGQVRSPAIEARITATIALGLIALGQIAPGQSGDEEARSCWQTRMESTASRPLGLPANPRA